MGFTVRPLKANFYDGFPVNPIILYVKNELWIRIFDFYEYHPSKHQRKPRYNAENCLEKRRNMVTFRHLRVCPVTRTGDKQDTRDPQRTPNERYATHTILNEPYTVSNRNHIQ